jgi:hypothetical protein
MVWENSAALQLAELPLSEEFVKPLRGDVDLAKDFSDQGPGKVPAGMNGERGRAAVGMPEEREAAFPAHPIGLQPTWDTFHRPASADLVAKKVGSKASL